MHTVYNQHKWHACCYNLVGQLDSRLGDLLSLLLEVRLLLLKEPRLRLQLAALRPDARALQDACLLLRRRLAVLLQLRLKHIHVRYTCECVTLNIHVLLRPRIWRK